MRYLTLIKLSAITIILFHTGLVQADSKQADEKQRMYPNEQPITFETMDGLTTDAYSGFIPVPENRQNPASREIKVHYVRFPSNSDTATAPIIYLAGGPGGSGINTAKYPNFRFPLFMALREFGDVIALDQRGTGLSNDTPQCNSKQRLNHESAQTELEVTQQYLAAAIECAGLWKQQGIDINGYTTEQSARDLNDLRVHLQAQKMALWGISYGSHLAFATMKLFPGQIDKVVIASAEGLNQTVKLPEQTDAYFARLQDAVNTQDKARNAYPDIIGMMKKVHQKLAQEPLTVQYKNKAGDAVILFQKQHMQMLAAGMIADPHRYATLLLHIYRTLDQGDVSVLQEVLKRGYFDNTQISFQAMPLAMDVASGITSERLRLVEQQAESSLLGLALNFPMPHLNRVLPDLDLGDEFRTNPTNAIPTLLLSGTLDGRTYPQSQYEATSGLAGLTKVTVVNAGHNLFMSSPEVTEVIKTFLAGEEIRDSEIVVELPNFVE